MRALLLLLCMTSAASAGCADHPAAHRLDFWLGDWVVTTEDGTRLGENRLEKTLDGCLVQEHWTGAKGGRGEGFHVLDARAGQWRQLWVTRDTSQPGGLQEFTLSDKQDAQGGWVYVAKTEAPHLHRTTLLALPDGRVRQTIRVSDDNGATWTTPFDGFYTKK
jgi:hypothetical protein